MLIHFIYNIPNAALLLLIIAISIAISMIGLYVVQRNIPLITRIEYNDGIGFIAATTGVLYAILIGLIAVSVVNNYDKSQEDANSEADTVVAIYHLANNLPDSIRNTIQHDTEAYLKTVIKDEWPYMREGKVLPNMETINQLNLLTAHYKGQNLQESLALDKLTENINTLYNAHKEREKWALTSVHPDVMIVLLIGTLLIILVHLLLGIDFILHVISIVSLDIVVSSILFLVVAVDRPYMGYISVEPTVFQTVLDRMNQGTL